MSDLEVTCLASDLPEYIEVDMAEVKLDETIHLSDLIIPEGVEISALVHGGEDSQPVVSVHVRKAAPIEEDVVASEEEAEGEEGASEEGDGTADGEGE